MEAICSFENGKIPTLRHITQDYTLQNLIVLSHYNFHIMGHMVLNPSVWEDSQLFHESASHMVTMKSASISFPMLSCIYLFIYSLGMPLPFPLQGLVRWAYWNQVSLSGIQNYADTFPSCHVSFKGPSLGSWLLCGHGGTHWKIFQPVLGSSIFFSFHNIIFHRFLSFLVYLITWLHTIQRPSPH
jgi:hypothetical protein